MKEIFVNLTYQYINHTPVYTAHPWVFGLDRFYCYMYIFISLIVQDIDITILLSPLFLF